MTPRDHDLRSIQPRAKFVALRWLGAGALACASLSANAAYADAIPPAGFSRTGDAWTYRAANANEWLANTVRTNATLNVGGRAITLPAAMRMASNAPRFAAASLFSPAGMAAMAGSVALTALLSHLAEKGINWDDASKSWTRTSTGYIWRNNSGNVTGPSAASVCQQVTPNGWQYTVDSQTDTAARCVLWYGSPDNHGGYEYVQRVQAAQPTTEPITYPDYETELLPYITPDKVPDLVPPGTPIPVDLPIINPSPGDFPVPQVRRIPLGDPVPQPAPGQNYPMQFRQPVLDIKGSPTQSQPWRVDVQPKDIITEAPQGEPAPNPVTDPVDVPDPNADPAQSEAKEPGLCERYPDILACQKPDLDTPTDEVPKAQREISFTPESLFGGGTCPANPGWSDALGNHELNLAPVCDILATVVRPLVLAMAALAALFIVAPFRTDT